MILRKFLYIAIMTAMSACGYSDYSSSNSYGSYNPYQTSTIANSGIASNQSTPNNPCNCKGYSGPGGACYAGPGGPCYSGPGGTGLMCPRICK